MDKQIFPGIETEIDLTPYNTLGVSAVAPVFIDITSANQLSKLYREGFFEQPFPFVLGGGSNILFLGNPSKAVIKISIAGKHITDENESSVMIEIGAGENWHNVVSWAVENNLGGIENLALIPGTAGAAPIQNIGAYGVELAEVFDSLELFDMRDGSFKNFQRKECRFGYRESLFKNELKGKVIVTRVKLRLTKTNHTIQDSYRSLQSYLLQHNIPDPEIRDIYDAVIRIRRSKLPDPDLIGNAGSFFKNPVVNRETFRKLYSEYAEMPYYKISDTEIKIPAAWLIEKAGWKGKRVGDVGTYENQALVIVNHGNASGTEIYHFSRQVQKSVSDTFGIELVPEVNVVE